MAHHSKDEIMFTQLILMFHTAAMQQLGKLKNPLTDAIERNLEAAQNSIDILDMLKDKTAGNLSEEEGRLLSQVIRELKLNYVDEAKKPDVPPDQKP
jgi:hypothetical protein